MEVENLEQSTDGEAESESSSSVLGFVKHRYAARLLLSLLLAVALILAVGLVVQAQTESQVKEDARGDLMLASEVQADELNQWVVGNERQTRTVSELPTIRSDDPEKISPRLKSLVENGHVSDEVVAIHYVNLEKGQVVASSKDRFVGAKPAKQGAPFVSKLKEGFSGPDEVYVSKPFEIPIADFPVVAMLSPVPGPEKRMIVFMINPTGETEELAQPVEGGFTQVVTEDGTLVAQPGNESSLSTQGETAAIDRALDGGIGVTQTGSGQLVGYAPVEGQDWVVLVHAPTDAAFALSTTVGNGLLGLVGLALVSLGLVGVTIGRNTAISLRSLAQRADELGKGNLDVEFETRRSDEIGTLADTLTGMRDSLREQIESTQQLNDDLERKASEYGADMHRLAEGDLTVRMEADSRSQAMNEIAESFNEMAETLAETTGEAKDFSSEVARASSVVDDSSEEIRRASVDVSESIQAISDSVDSQNRTLQSVNREMSDLSTTVEEIASSSSQVATTADRTAEAGQEGREAAQAAARGMTEIEEGSDAVADEIETLDSLIDEIEALIEMILEVAEKTNMLALNANIEATRSSKDNAEGFAVVAGEVKELAQETKSTTSEVENRLEDLRSEREKVVTEIADMNDRVDENAESIRDAIESLDQIAGYAEEVNTGVQDIRAATEQQAASTQEVVAMIENAVQISKQVSEEAESVAAAAEEQTSSIASVSDTADTLESQASQLEQRLGTFTVPDDEFEFQFEESIPTEEGPDDGPAEPASRTTKRQ